MKPEALSQVSDALSFLLVTPEFLPEHRLGRVRQLLANFVVFILSYLGIPYTRTTRARDCLLIIAVGIMAEAMASAISSAVALIPLQKFEDITWYLAFFGYAVVKIAQYFCFAVSALVYNIIILALLGLFIIGIEKVVIRGILFLIGSTLFFLTRAMLFWFFV